jgi:hypothetical protein
MSVAAVQPDFSVFLHVLGATVMVGVTATAVLLLAVSLRARDRAATVRFAFRTLLYGAIPAYVAMRVGAEWTASNENVPDDVEWIGIGYSVADGGLLLLIVTAVLAGIAARRARRSPAAGTGLLRAATAITVLLVVADVVAIWAMGTKPS